MQFVRYCIIGVINTALDFGIYTGLTRGFAFWSEHYLVANVFSFTMVVTWSFFWNKYWTFKNRERQHASQYAKFVIATIIGVGISESILYVGVELFSLHDILSKVIAAPLVVAWNFSAYRTWTFTPLQDPLERTLTGQERSERLPAGRQGQPGDESR